MTVTGITSMLSKTPAAAPPGAPPGVAPTLPLFDDLLTPALPATRHDPATPGKSLPDDETAAPDEPAGTIPPILPAICPQPASPRAADPIPAIAAETATTPLPPLPATIRPTLPIGAGAAADAMEPIGQPLPAALPNTAAPPAHSPGIALTIPGARPVLPVSRHAAETPAPASAPDIGTVAPAPVPPLPPPPATTSVARDAILPTTRQLTPAAAPPTLALATMPSTSPAAIRPPTLDAHRTEAPLPPAPIVAAVVAQPPPAASLAATALPAVSTAGRVFADAIHRALVDTDRQPTQPGVLAASATAVDLAPHAVTATADARHAALDMQRETWPTQMIARIETLRDAANANDTSIRLIPDALGTIDVSLKRDGERVHVDFTATQPETRQLLADTRAQLTDLAAARGLTLSLGGGGSGAGQPQRQHPAFVSSAPPRAIADNDDHPSDQRIA